MHLLGAPKANGNEAMSENIERPYMAKPEKEKPAEARSKETCKAEAIAYLMQSKKLKPDWSQADQIRLAIARFILDQLGEDDQAVRKDVVSSFLEMPAWFGASANAMQECPDYVQKVKKLEREFSDEESV